MRALTCAMALATILIGLASPTIASNLSPGEVATLPVRPGPRPDTTNNVPHVQIDLQANPRISAELLRRVAATTGIEIGATVVSLPGAKGFWVAPDIEIARQDVIVRGREFAHLHPDGSLHASLPPETAQEAVKAGWATPHPWANKRAGWEGFVMIYTPTSEEELDVVFQLVMNSFEFVTGQ